MHRRESRGCSPGSSVSVVFAVISIRTAQCGGEALTASELKEKGSVGEKHALIGDPQQPAGHDFAINL